MKSFHMSPEDFRHNAELLAEWIAQYHTYITEFPVKAKVAPGEVRAQLPASAPETGESFQQILTDVDKILLPGITHWQSPNFFAYFPANASGPSILGDMLSSGFGVQGMLWATSPACTELETHVLDWIVEMLDLPRKFLSSSAGGGVIQDSASSASLCAVLAARERATNYKSNEEGGIHKLTAYTSSQAHSSIEKAIKIAGIGSRNLRVVDVDDSFAMRPELLEKRIEEDLRAGHKPAIVCATVGTTSSNAIDPLRAIGEICAKHGIWLHVDAAMSGPAAICPEFRWIHDGLELADSYCFDPHKWLFTNFDCTCFYVADRKALIHTLSVLPEYLRDAASESGAVIDYRDWHVPLGRRFRALKLWFVIRHYGVQGLQAHIRRHVELAQMLTEWIRQDDSFELAAPAPLNLVCFRLKKDDSVNQQLLEGLNQSGKLYLSHTRLNGKYTLRLCVGQTWTELEHIQAAWELIREHAEKLEEALENYSSKG